MRSSDLLNQSSTKTMLSTVQSNFLLYSSFSLISAILIGTLFWKKEDRSSKLWLLGCLLTAISSSVTVFRSEIPLAFSYSLMVALEFASVLLFSEALKNLSIKYTKPAINWMLFGFPIGYFLLVETARLASNGQVTPVISAISTFVFGSANLLCFFQTKTISKEFKNRLFFNFFSIIFISMACVYFIRSLNVIAINDGHAFLTETFNVIIWFLLLFLGVVRNLTYIVLRLQLGFTEHSRLNNMNLMLTNMLEERDAMIQSLERLNKSASINALATSIAHEINQPIAASRLYAELATMNLNDDPNNVALHKETVHDILSEIDRAAVIVRNLTNLNSVTERSTTLVNLLDTVTDVTKISNSRMRDLDIKLEINCLPEHFIRINVGAWHQVLMNILNNAIDALASKTEGGRKIIVSVHKFSDVFEVSIQDNGIGIPAGQEANIFQLAMTTKKTGSGIGLWLSRNIIESYGGDISAKNTLDGGAQFIIKFQSA
jgi:signal transduction histidine kinase